MIIFAFKIKAYNTSNTLIKQLRRIGETTKISSTDKSVRKHCKAQGTNEHYDYYTTKQTNNNWYTLAAGSLANQHEIAAGWLAAWLANRYIYVIACFGSVQHWHGTPTNQGPKRVTVGVSFCLIYDRTMSFSLASAHKILRPRASYIARPSILPRRPRPACRARATAHGSNMTAGP